MRDGHHDQVETFIAAGGAVKHAREAERAPAPARKLFGATRAKHVRAQKLEAKILAHLANAASPLSVRALASAFRLPSPRIYGALVRMRNRSEIESVPQASSRAHLHAVKTKPEGHP